MLYLGHYFILAVLRNFLWFDSLFYEQMISKSSNDIQMSHFIRVKEHTWHTHAHAGKKNAVPKMSCEFFQSLQRLMVLAPWHTEITASLR